MSSEKRWSGTTIRVTIAGIYNFSAPFQNLPVVYVRLGRERNLLSFVLVKAVPGVRDAEACRRIEAAVSL
jgi:hypothetical protein